MSIFRSGYPGGFLITFLLAALPLSAGSLSVSGVPGTFRYRVEHSEQLLGDWIEKEVNHSANTAQELFRNKRAAWISLFFRHAATGNARYVEVFVGADDDVEMSFEWNPGLDADQLSVTYARHPALDYQIAYDNFTSDRPANHAIEIADLKRTELTGPDADLNLVATQWVDEQLGLLTSTLTTPAEAQPYRTRMTWRMLHALCGMTYDGDVLPELNQQRRDSLVLRAISPPPVFADNFRGRFWSGYMSIRADLGAGIRPALADPGLPDAVTERCGEPLENIRPSYAKLLVYTNDDALEYVYASQLQGQIETFANNPDLFDRELDFFRCLFPESIYLQRLLD